MELTPRKMLLIFVGAMIYSFGIHNIHQRTGITEGGILGMMILIEHWLGFSMAYITPVLDGICYLTAYRFLGGRFIRISAFSTLCVSCFFKLWEMMPPMLPDLYDQPFIAAILGGIMVGGGVGLIIRQGGSAGGDDALALSISHIFHWRLSRSYLFADVSVLLLSLTYIPLARLVFSLITVTVSSYMLGLTENYKSKNKVVQADDV